MNENKKRLLVNKGRRFVNNLRKITKRNWPTPVNYIGGGANGKVYLTNSGKLMKIAAGAQPMEFRALNILRNTKFVPKFNKKNWAIVPTKKMNSFRKLFGWNYNKGTVFLMNKIRGNKVVTLQQYIKFIEAEILKPNIKNALKERIRNKVKQMVKMIHERGISHGDLHNNNILVDMTNKGNPKLWMIDFGRSVPIPFNKTERNVYYEKFKHTNRYRSNGMLSRPDYDKMAPLYENNKNSAPKRLNSHMLLVHYGVSNYPRNIKSKSKSIKVVNTNFNVSAIKKRYARRHRKNKVNQSLNYLPIAFLNKKWRYYIPMTLAPQGYVTGHFNDLNNKPFTLFSNTKNFDKLFRINEKTGRRNYISRNLRNEMFNANNWDPNDLMEPRRMSHFWNSFKKRIEAQKQTKLPPINWYS